MIVTTDLEAAARLLTQWDGREVRITDLDWRGADSQAVRGVFLPDYHEIEDGDDYVLRLGMRPAWWLGDPGFCTYRSEFRSLIGSFGDGVVTLDCTDSGFYRIERVEDDQLRLEHAAFD